MALEKFAFRVLKTDKYARCGLIKTPRGEINTPAFMPVGTQATVKACKIEDIKKTGTEIILGNTYHLMIRPGVERIERVGGLHKFMNFDLPILTDSGGFQIMSLSKLNKIDREKGAIFNSHVDGKKFYLSPEESIRAEQVSTINRSIQEISNGISDKFPSMFGGGASTIVGAINALTKEVSSLNSKLMLLIEAKEEVESSEEE